MRCLALAGALRNAGCAVTFISRHRPGDLIARIRESGFPVVALRASQKLDEGSAEYWLGATEYRDAEETRAALDSIPERVSWVIADNFEITAAWERHVRGAAERILSIDDRLVAERACDAVLSPQAVTQETDARIEHLAAAGIRVFAGPQFFILSQSVERARGMAAVRSGAPKNILVAFGGATNLELAIDSVRAVRAAGADAAIHVVLGGEGLGNAVRAAIGENNGITIYDHVYDIEDMYAMCDLSIGSDGIMMFERCLLGLPAIIVPVETRWAWSARELQNNGCAVLLPEAARVSPDDVQRAVTGILESPETLERMSLACLQFMEPYEPLDGGVLVRWITEN